MSEDRTQAPARRRRQQARERGLVARSPELTAAVGLLTAAALLGVWGDDLAASLAAVIGAALRPGGDLAVDVPGVVVRLRQTALAVGVPLAGVIGGAWAAALAAHQAQVGGLWAPGLLTPDPQRLWGGGVGLGARAARGAWMVAKAAVVVGVTAWVLGAHRTDFERLAGLEARDLARTAGGLLRGLTLELALAMLALGLADYALQARRIEAQLRATPEEHREDLRAVEGDPALRARRRRIARAWRRDPGEPLAGAAVLLTGPAGLTLVLAGSPPPGRVAVRLVARGTVGLRLRAAADDVGVPRVEAPELARRLARRRELAAPEVLTALAAVWPGD
ncbi:MAG TPA: EscU/YscU/HrcU family type III secretion system export apparatus switch protein [Isosphaeraceae bacterium]